MFSNRPSTITTTTNLSCHGFPWPLSPFCAYRVSTLTGLSTPPAPALTITPKNFLALAPLQGRSPQTHNTFTQEAPGLPRRSHQSPEADSCLPMCPPSLHSTHGEIVTNYSVVSWMPSIQFPFILPSSFHHNTL